MKKEIAAVVFFLKRLIKKAEKLESDKLDLFVERLTVALQEKYKGHWYPDNPSKGQAFRYSSTVQWHPSSNVLFIFTSSKMFRMHVMLHMLKWAINVSCAGASEWTASIKRMLNCSEHVLRVECRTKTLVCLRNSRFGSTLERCAVGEFFYLFTTVLYVAQKRKKSLLLKWLKVWREESWFHCGHLLKRWRWW